MPLSGKIKMDDIGGKSLGLSIMMNLASEEGISQAKKTVLTKKKEENSPQPCYYALYKPSLTLEGAIVLYGVRIT